MGWSTEADGILLQRGHPRFELAATLLTPMNWGPGIDDLADDFADRTSRSMPEPTESMLTEQTVPVEPKEGHFPRADR